MDQDFVRDFFCGLSIKKAEKAEEKEEADDDKTDVEG